MADLRTALGANFDQAWALTRTDKDATAWIYPTAYHIKVAVRDSKAVWGKRTRKYAQFFPSVTITDTVAPLLTPAPVSIPRPSPP